jgi:arabinose-5-phosphate isomerase
MDSSIQQFACQVIEIEAQAVRAMSAVIGEDFEKACRMILDCQASVLVTGMGKAGHVARKMSATLSSTGTPSHFLSAGDATHGDLGAVRKGDIVIIFSASGESEEVIRLLSLLKQLDHTVIAITSSKTNSLGRHADLVLPMGKVEEACPLGLAPSASSTAMLALGDALALSVMKLRDFTAEQFAMFHPAGQIGRRLTKVREAMTFLRGHNLPMSADNLTVGQVLHERTELSKRLNEKEKRLRLPGAIVLIDGPTGKLAGIFTDGDLRRLIDATNGQVDLQKPVREVMTRNPKSIRGEALASESLAIMQKYRIDELPVVDENGMPIGLIDIQDLILLKMLDVT